MKANKLKVGDVFNWKGHEVIVTNTWVDPDNNKPGISIKPTGNYGFEIDIYLEKLKTL